MLLMGGNQHVWLGTGLFIRAAWLGVEWDREQFPVYFKNQIASFPDCPVTALPLTHIMGLLQDFRNGIRRTESSACTSQAL